MGIKGGPTSKDWVTLGKVNGLQIVDELVDQIVDQLVDQIVDRLLVK